VSTPIPDTSAVRVVLRELSKDATLILGERRDGDEEIRLVSESERAGKRMGALLSERQWRVIRWAAERALAEDTLEQQARVVDALFKAASSCSSAGCPASGSCPEHGQQWGEAMASLRRALGYAAAQRKGHPTSA
jgi:hypothetical protein